MGDASVDDYLEFPAREIAASGKVRAFARQADPAVAAALRGETIVYEAYGDGMAEDSVVTSFSVAKSFVSAMMGKAIEKGLVWSLDEPVTAYLPELANRDPRFGAISLRNLLAMSSGLAYRPFPDARADDIQTYYNPDLRTAARERTVVEEAAGRHFLYNNWAHLETPVVF
jgi:CubicO group peptidase (beta-lactamase class C family)